MGTKGTKLTDKQRRFVSEYLKDLNATQAAIRAGYPRKTANSVGPENLVKPGVQAAIQAAIREREAANRIQSHHVIDELAKVAMSDIGDVLSSSPDGRYVTVRHLGDLTPAARRCIKSIKQTTHQTMDDDRAMEKVVLQVELHPKVQALDLLMAHFGLKTPDKIDVHVNVTSAKDSLEAKLDELRTRNQPEQPEPGGTPSAQPG